MSIRVRKDGRYIIDYYPQGRRGKRVRKLLPPGISQEAARKLDIEIRGALKKAREKPVIDPAVPTATVKDLLPDYLEWYALHRAPTSLADVTLIAEGHWKKLLADYRVTEIGPEHLALYQSQRKKQKVSNRTINKELDYFGGFLSWCRRIKRLDCRKPVIDKLPYKRRLPVVLTPEEVWRIVDQCAPRLRAFVLCLYTLGLRLNEARNLLWSDVDIPGSRVRVLQKGGSYKVLPMNEWLVEALEALPRDGARVFASQKGQHKGKPVQSIRKALNSAAKRAGVTKHVHAHLFRHSWATHLLAAGVNMRVIQQFLGHSDIQMTTWYSQVSVEVMRDAGRKMLPEI